MRRTVRKSFLPNGLRTKLAAAGFALLLICALDGCGRSAVDAQLASFTKQGHAVVSFAEIDKSSFGAKKCQAGTIDELPVLLCEYESSDAAKLGQSAAESWGGDGTSVVLYRGSILFAVADRENADANGQKIAALSKVFRRGSSR